MIHGIGTDVCDVRRIRASLERHGERFAHKVLLVGVASPPCERVSTRLRALLRFTK